MNLYYNNATADGDLGNLLNWWQDAGFTIPGAVPTTADVAFIHADASANTGGVCVPGELNHIAGSFTTTIVVSGAGTAACTIQDSASAAGANITAATVLLTGTCDVSGSTFTAPLLTISGSAIVATIDVTGSVLVNSASAIVSDIDCTGNFTFTANYADALPNNGGTVGGTMSFTGTVTWSGTDFSDITAYGNGSACTWIFVNRNNSGTFAAGVADFRGTSANSGPVTCPDVRMANGINSASITGNLAITGTGTNEAGTVSGKLTVPGTKVGATMVTSLTETQLGTFGSLAISGVKAGGPTRIGKNALIG